MTKNDPYAPRTRFLKITMARAVVPRWKERADDLHKLERLIMARKWAALTVGRQLEDLARRWPISYRALVIEIYTEKPTGWVEVAESIELDLWAIRARRRRA